MKSIDEMNMDEKIARINELYHLSKERELNDYEAAEQKALRKAYIESVKANMRAQLDNIDIVEKDGSITHLEKKH